MFLHLWKGKQQKTRHCIWIGMKSVYYLIILISYYIWFCIYYFEIILFVLFVLEISSLNVANLFRNSGTGNKWKAVWYETGIKKFDAIYYLNKNKII